jgi:hypothetical protein
MSSHVLISDGRVVEIIEPLHDAEGKEFPIEERFPPDFVAKLVDVSSVSPTVEVGWLFDDGMFTKPVSARRAKDEILESIKAERDRLMETGGFSVGGKWYHSDVFSRTQQMGLVMLGANIPAGTQWKTMDGSFVAMTPTLASQILAAGAANDIAIFQASERHLGAVAASKKPDAYDYSTGWPTAYGE